MNDIFWRKSELSFKIDTLDKLEEVGLSAEERLQETQLKYLLKDISGQEECYWRQQSRD